MKSGISFKQGDIILVPFPFSDLSGAKKRPVLVISNDQYNKDHDDLITCGITSNIFDREYSVLIDDDNLSEGKLPLTSLIKVDKIFTLNRSIIRRKIGRLNLQTFSNVKKILSSLIS